MAHQNYAQSRVDSPSISCYSLSLRRGGGWAHAWWQGCLGVLERGNARQDLALEQLERGAAAGRDVRHLLGEAGLLHRGYGVTAADAATQTVTVDSIPEGW